MCTALIWFDPTADVPLCVAFNRDERYSRLEESPRLIRGAAVDAVYPIDVRSGGTWFGVNLRGVVGLLLNDNRSGGSGSGSRGRWLAKLLTEASSIEAAEAAVCDTWDPSFTASWAVLASADRLVTMRLNTVVSRYELLPGIHVVCDSSGFGQSKRGRWLRERAALRPSPTCFADVRDLVSEHASCTRRYYTTCCHAGISGTVSTQFVHLSRSRREVRLSYLPGRPCGVAKSQDFIVPFEPS